MGNTAFDNSGLLQQAPAGSSGFNQEVRNTGQGLVLPVPIAHVGSGSLTGNSSSYLAGRARCKVQTTEEKMTSLRSDLLPRLCTLSGLLSHQQELISKSSILSNMLLRKSYWQEGAVRRAQSWKASLTTCRSLLLVGLHPQSRGTSTVGALVKQELRLQCPWRGWISLKESKDQLCHSKIQFQREPHCPRALSERLVPGF